MRTNPSYSEEALTADLRKWWKEQVTDEDDPFSAPRTPRSGTIFEVVPAVDSLSVVAALVAMEKHLDFEVPPRIIKPGGYRDCEEMIADLLPKVRDLRLKQSKKEAA
jgi:acyl carrier protein